MQSRSIFLHRLYQQKFDADLTASSVVIGDKIRQIRKKDKIYLRIIDKGLRLQNLTLTPCFYINIYQKVVYVYFYENIFQDKSTHMVFIFPNTTT